MKPTREQILAEPAGNQMDAWVAEYVMGFAVARDKTDPRWVLAKWRPANCITCGCDDGLSHTDFILPYSADIAAAWRVVEKTGILCHESLQKPFNMDWEVGHADMINQGEEVLARGDTAPLAICRAALLETCLRETDAMSG